MSPLRTSRITLTLFFVLLAPARAQTDNPPILQGPVELRQDDSREAAPAVAGPRHEALAEAPAADPALRVAPPPPPPIVERPSSDPPSQDARWVEGYWAWDTDRGDYVWAAGTWVVPPPGKIWVSGTWRRDERGWRRIPGSWAERRTDRVDWRVTGPPADRPPDEPGPPPGPGYFYVPGQYVPDGDGLAWRKGFWARSQPGWDWVPGYWVRQSSGWAFREGHWIRAPLDSVTRHEVARPVEDDTDALRPIPEDDALRPAPDAATPPPEENSAPDAPPGGVVPIPAPGPRGYTSTSVVVVPGRVYVRPGPYPYPPPGYYYGPRAAVPWGALPPFARRVLNRVLP